MSKELQDYISQARTKGFSDKDIYDQLAEAGWNKKDIAESLGMNIPSEGNASSQQNKNILLPVAIRIIGIVLLAVAFIVIYFIFGAIGGSPLPLTSFFWVVFFYIPITLLTLSTISLLSGKGSRSFDFQPNRNAKRLLNNSSTVIGVIIVIMVILYLLGEFVIG